MANSYTSSTRSIDEFAELIASKTKSEMDEFSSAKRPELISRKDPLAESIKYLSKNDVYELFKLLTVNLVLDKPLDPIRSMIDQIKEAKAQQAK